MGLCNAPDIFQERLSELMMDLEFTRAHIDDLLVVSSGSFDNHMDHLEQVLTRLQEAGLKVNITKSDFCKTELECLGQKPSGKGSCSALHFGFDFQSQSVFTTVTVFCTVQTTACRHSLCFGLVVPALFLLVSLLFWSHNLVQSPPQLSH